MSFLFGLIIGIVLALAGVYAFVVWLSDFDGSPFPDRKELPPGTSGDT